MKKRVLSQRQRRMLTIIYLLIIILTPLFLYTALGSEPLSPTMRFRRAERANMAGPSKIIAMYEKDNDRKDHVFIAETKDSYILFLDIGDLQLYRRFHDTEKGDYPLHHFFYVYEKTEHINLYSISDTTSDPDLVLFDLSPTAVRAQIQLEWDYWADGKAYTESITLEAQRQYDDFFLFSVTGNGNDYLWGYARSALVQMTTRQYSDAPPVTVRLYNADGELICAENILPGPN